MPKKAGIAIVLIGAVLILSALLLFLANRQEDASAGEQAQSILHEVQAAIAERDQYSAAQSATTAPPEEMSPTPTETATQTDPLPTEMTVVELKGYGYIGYLFIPALKLELPVMSDWDYNRLKIAPCRHFGSVFTDDLVIAAHNYTNHFAYLRSLKVGDPVFFTDMDGQEHSYQVTEVSILSPEDVDAVQNSGHDLVLYTCTYGSESRVVVFCDRP